jgi:hypothetical protein
VVTIQEPDGDLDSGELVLAGEVYGALRMLEIHRIKRVGAPVSQSAQVKPSTGMLQQNSHASGQVWVHLPRSHRAADPTPEDD